MLAFQQLSKGEKHDDYQMGNFRLKKFSLDNSNPAETMLQSSAENMNSGSQPVDQVPFGVKYQISCILDIYSS